MRGENYFTNTRPLVSENMSSGVQTLGNGLGATTTRIVPEGTRSSIPLSAWPGVLWNALRSAAYGVSGFNSSWPWTMSEMPVSRAITDQAAGLSGYGASAPTGGIGFSTWQSHPACISHQKICRESWYESGSSFTYNSSTFALGLSANAFVKASPSIRRASNCFRTSASFSSASFVRAVASAICAFALAMSACAMPRSALAFAVSNSTTLVRHSDCSSRMVVVRHCNNKNAIVAQAPTAVINPPNRTPFHETGYQYSAHSNSEGSTATSSAPFWFFAAISIVIAAPIALLALFAVMLWRWRPRS